MERPFNIPTVEVTRLVKEATLPTASSTNNIGLDVYASEDVFIKLGETITVDTGVFVKIPRGFFGKVEDRNSLAAIGIKSSGGVVDSNGSELKVILHNLNNGSESSYRGRGYGIKKGEKIAQLIVQPVVFVNLVEPDECTERSFR